MRFFNKPDEPDFARAKPQWQENNEYFRQGAPIVILTVLTTL